MGEGGQRGLPKGPLESGCLKLPDHRRVTSGLSSSCDHGGDGHTVAGRLGTLARGSAGLGSTSGSPHYSPRAGSRTRKRQNHDGGGASNSQEFHD